MEAIEGLCFQSRTLFGSGAYVDLGVGLFEFLGKYLTLVAGCLSLASATTARGRRVGA